MTSAISADPWIIENTRCYTYCTRKMHNVGWIRPVLLGVTFDILDWQNRGKELLGTGGEKKKDVRANICSVLFLPPCFCSGLPWWKDACSEGTAQNSPHTRPTMFKGMKYGYFTGMGTRSDMYPYFSLWIVDVFIGHHLLCPSPYSLSWWVRRGVQGEGAGKDLIGCLFWPTQVKWNDCYCTLHNSWECHFLRSQYRLKL